MTVVARTLFLILLIQITCLGCTPDLDKASSFKTIFNHYRTGEEVIAISLPPSLISLVMQQAGEENELMQLFRDLSSFSLLTLERQKTPQETYDEFGKVLKSYSVNNHFVDMFFVNSAAEEFYIKVREKDDHIQEALIVIGSPDSYTAIDLRGNIDPKLLTNLAEQGGLMDILELDLLGF